MADSNKLRPVSFDTYIGQDLVLRELEVFVKAAQLRGTSVGHVLFSGPPGLGKTSIAQVIANEVGSRLHFVTAPTITDRAKLIEILFKLGEGDILFIDEIHRMNIKVEEVLYAAVEDFKAEVTVIGENGRQENMLLPLPRFTLVGATTLVGLVSSPLRTRFQKIFRMEYYSEESLTEIALSSAKKLGINLTSCGAYEVARRARGTPRTVNQHLAIVRDHSIVKNIELVTGYHVDKFLEESGIDSLGLTRDDTLYLEALRRLGRPSGVKVIASLLGESPVTLEESIEPYLLRIGMIKRAPNGRVITKRGIKHLSSVNLYG